MKMVKGVSGNPNGRPKGIPNKATTEFRQAVVNLLEYAAPKMVEWLEQVAENDPNRALEHVGKLAEYASPKLARNVVSGDPDNPIQNKVTFSWDK